jgi:hypothetical protein
MSHQTLPYRLGATWVGSSANPALNTPPIVEMPVASNNTLAVFAGDLCEVLTGGTIYPCTRGGGSYPSLSYVVVSMKQYLGVDGVVRRGNYLPATTVYTGTTSIDNPLASIALCIPVTGQLFAMTVPTAEATTTAAQAKVGKCIDVNPGAGVTKTGLSGHLIYTGTDATYGWQATTVAGQLRLEKIPQYGITGTLNDPTIANWTGIFSAYETLFLV